MQYSRQYKSFSSQESQAHVIFSLSSSKDKQFAEFGFKIRGNISLERWFPTLWINNRETYSWTCIFVGLSLSLLISLLSRSFFGKVALKGRICYGFNTESSTMKTLSKEVLLGEIKKKCVRTLLPGADSLHFECLVTGYFHLLIQKIC